ncbi:MAG TPA: nicotinate (nicotinamide) nucleotide adenylyltransferase [Spirochaetia bacterium]|nr:nicotinate (nicotinamide) nucleotide adenylyltransferase [Spirochaetia bacterium]
MKAVILGGTFNPVHYGHLFIAEEVRSSFGYDSAIFLPANQPVHKDPTPVLPAAHRLEMLRRAVRGCPKFLVVESEIKRSGPSYSIDTVEELMGKFGFSGKPGFLIGDDLVEGFPTWKDAGRLSRMVDLFIARRTLAAPVALEYPHRVVPNMILPISSSEIRRRISEGRTVRFLLPDGVLEYIEANTLYG